MMENRFIDPNSPNVMKNLLHQAEPSARHLNVLKKHFGHSVFKPMQWKIINSIIQEKKDNCAVMATGYGKSLCYQYPAVYCSGVTVVISPLISLMEDQVLNLKMNNIPACYLGSAQTQKKKTLDSVLNGDMRIVYMTPEYVTGDPAFLCRIPNIVLLAIDEAHCVSEWGHDFRPSYRHLSVLRDTLPGVPILAVTATATPNIIEDICTSLELRDANITNTGFDRPNLYLAASVKQDEIMADLRKLLGRDGQFSGSTIVYCSTIAICEKVCEVLSLSGINNRPYHSSISLKHRKEIHELFVKDLIQVVVATCAFGMGIDKPDVRCIIHYGAPKDLSAYYQEIGRAGRDGLSATCYTFYNSSDFSKNNMLFQSNSSNPKVQDHCKTMMKKVERYLVLVSCRRKFLLEHFSDPTVANACPATFRCCDNCENKDQSESLTSCDIHEEVTNFLKVIGLMRGRFGLGAYIKFIRGTADARIDENLKSNPLYGAGKKQKEVWWKALSRLCVRENLVSERQMSTPGRGRGRGGSFWANKGSCVYELSTLGQFYLQKGRSSGIVLRPSDELLKEEVVPRDRRTVENSNVWMNTSGKPSALEFLPHFKQEEVLVKRLQALRSELAQEQACLRYMIVTEKQLEDMANRKARCREDLVACGLTQHKINLFGRRFLEVIYESCSFNEPVPDLSEPAAEVEQADNKTNVQKSDVSNDKDWEDDAFFGEIDYNQLDQSVNDEQNIKCETNEAVSVTTNDPASHSKLSVFNFQSKKLNAQPNVSSSDNESEVRSKFSDIHVQETQVKNVQTNLENKNQSFELAQEQTTTVSNETDWEDDDLFEALDYNQLDQSVSASHDVHTTEPEPIRTSVRKLEDHQCTSKRIKLLSSTVDVPAGPPDARLSLLKSETSKVSSELSVSSDSNLVSSFPLKKKPKSKLSKLL